MWSVRSVPWFVAWTAVRVLPVRILFAAFVMAPPG